ncbi:hypothetical protein CAF53_02475 [Sphingobium sp. LB126]|nr:hypothetical protein CAF53_02475 [Sphingobium sp. LB126]
MNPGALRHCYGIVLHHRRQWWLVEFAELDQTPIAAHRLTGSMTPAMTDWLRRETGDPRLSANISGLRPDTKCWSGEFSRLPSSEDPNAFDIDAHPWGSDAGELETRLARTLIDGSVNDLPAGFTSVLSALPENDEPVLAIRSSGYVCATFELLTARYMPDYRPRSPWRDISGDAVSDSGSDILAWRPARDWLMPN